MKVIMFGATGMVGQGVLRECLLDPGIEFRGLDAADDSAVRSELPAAEILISIDFTQEMAAAAKRLRISRTTT